MQKQHNHAINTDAKSARLSLLALPRAGHRGRYAAFINSICLLNLQRPTNMFLTRASANPHKLMRLMILLMALLSFKVAFSQTQYTGTLGVQTIHLFIQTYGDGVVHGVYMYDKYGSPIIVNGKLSDGTLELLEKGSVNNSEAFIKFQQFDPRAQEVKGEWSAKGSEKRIPINLKREFVIEDGEQIEAAPVEVIQASATKDHYFKTVVVKRKGDFYPQVTGVKVLKKGKNSVLQAINLEAEYRGASNVSVGDYNFDGLEDFSVFEASYAGPNTSSIYLLRNAKTSFYFESGFSGTSLEFDPNAKLIYEHNQCCAGSMGMNATYKVVNNKMKLIQKECYEMNSETGEMKTSRCE